MLTIRPGIAIGAGEVEFHAVRSRGPGGQHVNKTATAVQLRFDIRGSSLPEMVKRRLLRLQDNRITREGVIVIRSEGSRSQERNREQALTRLLDIIRGASSTRKRRVATLPPPGARVARLEGKLRRGRLKQTRRKVATGD